MDALTGNRRAEQTPNDSHDSEGHEVDHSHHHQQLSPRPNSNPNPKNSQNHRDLEAHSRSKNKHSHYSHTNPDQPGPSRPLKNVTLIGNRNLASGRFGTLESHQIQAIALHNSSQAVPSHSKRSRSNPGGATQSLIEVKRRGAEAHHQQTSQQSQSKNSSGNGNSNGNGNGKKGSAKPPNGDSGMGSSYNQINSENTSKSHNQNSSDNSSKEAQLDKFPHKNVALRDSTVHIYRPGWLGGLRLSVG